MTPQTVSPSSVGGEPPPPINRADYPITVNAVQAGADPTGVENSYAAVQALVYSLAARGGGTIYFDEGRFAFGANTLTLPEGANVNLRGAGRAATTLVWSAGTDDTFGIDVAIPALDTSADWKRRTIEGMRIEGPNSSGTTGRYGIRWSSGLVVRDCDVENWKASLYVWGNHQFAVNCKISGSAYNIWFPNAMPTVGDQSLIQCGLSTARVANIGIDDAQTMTAEFVDVHFGDAPYCIFAEVSGGATVAIRRAWFTNCNFESFGNAVINSSNRNVSACSFRSCVMSRNNANANADAVNAVFDFGTGTISELTFDHIEFFLAAASTNPPCFIKCAVINDCEFRGMSKVIDTVVTSNWDFVQATGQTNRNSVRWGNKTGRLARANTAITQGNLLTYDTFGTGALRVKTSAAGEITAGMAVHSQANGDCVLVQETGACTVPASGAIAERAYVKPAAAGAVATATPLVDALLSGFARQAAGGGFVDIELRPT